MRIDKQNDIRDWMVLARDRITNGFDYMSHPAETEWSQVWNQLQAAIENLRKAQDIIKGDR